MAHLVRVDRTQTNFAEVRGDLIQLALNHELDVRSTTFRLLYNLTTAIMRRPDEYTAISAALRVTFLNHMGQDVRSELTQESDDWGQGVRDVFIKLSESLDYIIFNHDLVWRTIIRHRRWLKPVVVFVLQNLKWIDRTVYKRTRKDPIVADIKATQQYIHRLTAAA
jgi:hypothetical protein